MGHIKSLIFPFVSNGNLMVLGVLIFKCLSTGTHITFRFLI